MNIQAPEARERIERELLGNNNNIVARNNLATIFTKLFSFILILNYFILSK